MKKSLVLILPLVLFTGCFETKFNFKTIIHPNGQTQREVRIDGRGANRFLPPSGPQWEIKKFETKGGQTILDDRNYHIEAQGQFKSPAQIGSDFRYDVAKLVANVTDETRQEFKTELGIKEPFDQEIRASNQIQFNLKRKLFTTDYEYSEIFQNRWIIPILVHDLKKEIIRQETVAIQQNADQNLPMSAAASAVISPVLVSPEKVEALAQEKLVKEILPQFQFHSEIVMPGKILTTNAKHVQGRTAVWDFRGSDFEKNYSSYTLHVSSQSVNNGTIVVFLAVVLFLLVMGIFLMTRKKQPKPSRRRKAETSS